MYNSCGYGRIKARRRLPKVRDLLAWKPEARGRGDSLAVMEAAAPLATLVLGRADCDSSENDGLRISFAGGATGGAGIAWSQRA